MVARLRAAGCVFAEDEAQVLVSAARTRGELDSMVARRAAGEPLEQVVGWAEFCGLKFLADPGVFVPRRRSEFLVAVAAGHAGRRAASAPPVIVDLCCGTGALGLAVAAELGLGTEPGGGPDRDGRPFGSSRSGSLEPGREDPAEETAGFGGAGFPARFAASLSGVELHAADIDPAAVSCARRNVEPAGGHVYAGDLFAALPGSLRGQIDVLVCNAPYVPTAEIGFMPAEAREHEALMALDGGVDGLAVLRRAASGAAGWLAPGGVLLVETSGRQAPSMAAAMTASGLTARVYADDEYGATVVTGVRRDDGLRECGIPSGSLGRRDEGSAGRAARTAAGPEDAELPDPRQASGTS